MHVAAKTTVRGWVRGMLDATFVARLFLQRWIYVSAKRMYCITYRVCTVYCRQSNGFSLKILPEFPRSHHGSEPIATSENQLTTETCFFSIHSACTDKIF